MFVFRISILIGKFVSTVRPGIYQSTHFVRSSEQTVIGFATRSVTQATKRVLPERVS